MQDKIVVDIGRIAMKGKGDLEPFQLFVQDAFPDKKNYTVLVAVFGIDGEKGLFFKMVDTEIGNQKNFLKYAFRKGSSRGGDITFTTKISESFATKLNTLKKNQLPYIIQVATQRKFEEELAIFKALDAFLGETESFEAVQKPIEAAYESLSKDEKKAALFSLRIDLEDGTERYVSDFKIFKDILFASGTEDKSEKYGVKSEGSNAQCSVCLEVKPLIYGFASPFKYFTIDKPGFVSGFFKQENTWKNYPICSDCSLPFELGRDYISQNLQGYFYGNPFYMIPKLILGNDEKKLGDVLKRMSELYKEMSVAKGEKLEKAEDKIMSLLGEEKDSFNVNLMFFEEDSKTKAIKIKLLLEELLPSRFRKLFVEIPREIDANSLYHKAITIKKEPKDLTFNYGTLKTFFDDDFLEIVNKLFTGMELSRELIFTRIMNKIRENYNRIQTSDGFTEPTAWTVLKAHQTLSYFQKLNLIHFKDYKYMDVTEPIENKKSKFKYEEFNNFVKQNSKFFDEDIKVGIFGLGMLVRYTMNIQYSKISSTPFEKKLKGYDLSLEDLLGIYQQALDKLRQYDSSGVYPKLREEILPKFLLNKHNPNRVSKNELSLYFVTGLEWAGKFKDSTKENEEEI